MDSEEGVIGDIVVDTDSGGDVDRASAIAVCFVFLGVGIGAGAELLPVMRCRSSKLDQVHAQISCS